MDNILAVARQVFTERGYENTAVSEIAARIGIVEGTIYKYFETKRELLLKVIESWYQELVTDYERNLTGVVDVHGRLRFLIWRHLQAIVSNPALTRLMFREVRSEADYPSSNLYELNKRYTGLILDVIQQGVNEGAFRADLPLGLARDMIFGGIEHHTWGFVAGRTPLDAELVADQVMSFVISGIRCDDSRNSLDRQIQRLEGISDRLERIHKE
ncbi:TetR/AcrR family transcriptional regulator [Cupriavidus necator]|uniref:TetR/AcrR family transcriptional regulator n=1 Tax=Cupriavidus necator TaxID=106590 RepID=UPI0039C2CED8